jgi:hypothetical protein
LAPSSSEPARPTSAQSFIVRADRALFSGMALGTALMLEPYWAGGLKWGFFLTLGCTVLEIITGHLLPQAPSS